MSGTCINKGKPGRVVNTGSKRMCMASGVAPLVLSGGSLEHPSRPKKKRDPIPVSSQEYHAARKELQKQGLWLTTDPDKVYELARNRMSKSVKSAKRYPDVKPADLFGKGLGGGRKKRKKLVKGSKRAWNYMAKLRSMKKRNLS